MLRIIILTSEFPPFHGGIGTYAAELASAVSALGHQVTVVAPGYGLASHSDDAKLPYDIRRFGGGASNIRSLPQRITLVRELYSSYKHVDVIHAADWPFFLPLALSKFRDRTKAVLSFHGSEVQYMRAPHRATAIAFARLWGSWAQYVSNSRYTDRILTSSFPAVSRLDHSAVPLAVSPDWLAARVPSETARARENVGPNRFVVLSVGRLVPRKGHLLVAEALSRLPGREQAEIDWIIVGKLDGSNYEAEVKEAAAKLDAKVTFTGAVSRDRLAQLMSAADVFCLPGHIAPGGQVEGFGLVYLEAAACGVPSIASESGGVPDAVDDGVTGILIRERDVFQLETAIAQLKNNPIQRRKMGAAALRKARSRSWIDVARETYEI